MTCFIFFSKIPAHADFDVINVEVVMTHIWAGKKKYPLFPLHPRSFRSWQRFFSRSVAVHIFSHTSSKLKNVDDPRYSAYALLGKEQGLYVFNFLLPSLTLFDRFYHKSTLRYLKWPLITHKLHDFSYFKIPIIKI